MHVHVCKDGGKDTSKRNSGKERDWEVVEGTFYSICFCVV